MSSPPELEAIGLSTRFGGLHVTNDVSLTVRSGEIHALIGPNGAGKTTLLNQLSGQLLSSEGVLRLDGVDITRWDAPARARAGVARSFQITRLIEEFTVRTNIELAVVPHMTRPRRASVRAAAEPIIAASGLGDIADTRVGSLPHGQKRFVDVAMAIAGKPRFVLLDEPFAGLGDDAHAQMEAAIRAMRERYGVLLVEHDIDTTFRLADRVTVLHEGRVIVSDTPAVVRNSSEVWEVYIGYS